MSDEDAVSGEELLAAVRKLYLADVPFTPFAENYLRRNDPEWLAAHPDPDPSAVGDVEVPTPDEDGESAALREENRELRAQLDDLARRLDAIEGDREAEP